MAQRGHWQCWARSPFRGARLKRAQIGKRGAASCWELLQGPSSVGLRFSDLRNEPRMLEGSNRRKRELTVRQVPGPLPAGSPSSVLMLLCLSPQHQQDLGL